jgi:hypothetical protein
METEPELSSDLYEESLAGAHHNLRVATVTNSKFYAANDIDLSKDFSLFLSNSNQTHWADLKQCKPGDVTEWCDFDSLLVGLITF